MKIHVLLFYKYVNIKNPEAFASSHLEFCKKLGILGKVLVAKEGINGSISGTKTQVTKYKSQLKKDKRFKEIVFKEDIELMHPFTRMAVRVKEEIVALKQKVNLKNKGIYISPKKFLEVYKKEKDKIGKDIIILDARNNYESRVGKFKNSLTPNISTFREFPKALKLLKGKEDKKIITYCTGGIRCEKTPPFFKQSGFKKVYQLEGGIVSFAKKFPDTVWEGKCFVFDKRMLSSVNTKDSKIGNCEVCFLPCNLYRNCKNFSCDKLTLICLNCEKRMNGCCSSKCLNEFRIGCAKKALLMQNKSRKIEAAC